jgi:hypothetical protein
MLVGLAAVTACLVPATAASASTLSQRGPTLVVDIDADGDTIDIRPTRPSQAYAVSSETALTNDGAAFCADVPGDSTSWICGGQDIRAAVRGSSAADSLFARCRSAASELTFEGDSGADQVEIVGCHPERVELGDGDDHARGTGGPIAGDGGNDTITGGAQADALSGGAGRDTLRGGAGADHLSGGPGNDLILPGAQTDVADGGDGFDTVSYQDSGAPVHVSLDGQANDGAQGEGDLVLAEGMIGSAFDDTLSGDAAANDIDGDDGSDVIDPAGGNDRVRAEAGNDRISVRDGASDYVACGPGDDHVIADVIDVLDGCELIDATRALLPDADADGIPAPADCDDANPAIRPALRDTPGNGIDEDCTGGDAPFPRVLASVEYDVTYGARARVKRLRVHGIAEGGRIELRCRGGGCFTGTRLFRFPQGKVLADIRGPLRRSRLKPGATVEVRILVPGAIGKILRLKFRRTRAPSRELLCLVPGQLAPHRCS